MPAPNRSNGTSTPTPSTRPTTATLGFAALTDPELSARDRVIFWGLANWAWGNKPECWPSNQAIGELTGYSSRSVQLALKQLVARGHLFKRMVITDRGWHRVLTIAERSRPNLTIVGGEGGGGATPCATPGATACATPVQAVAPPLAQPLAPELSLKPEERKKELAESSSPEEGTRLGQSKSKGEGEGEPAWLKVDNLTPAEVEHWRATAAEAGPMARIARKIVERIERKERESKPAPGSPSRSPGAGFEGNASQHGDSIKNPGSGQDK